MHGKNFFINLGGDTLSDVQNSRNIIIKWVGGGNIQSVPNLDFLFMKPYLKAQVERGKKSYLNGEKVLGVL